MAAVVQRSPRLHVRNRLSCGLSPRNIKPLATWRQSIDRDRSIRFESPQSRHWAFECRRWLAPDTFPAPNSSRPLRNLPFAAGIPSQRARLRARTCFPPRASPCTHGGSSARKQTAARTKRVRNRTRRGMVAIAKTNIVAGYFGSAGQPAGCIFRRYTYTLVMPVSRAPLGPERAYARAYGDALCLLPLSAPPALHDAIRASRWPMTRVMRQAPRPWFIESKLRQLDQLLASAGLEYAGTSSRKHANEKYKMDGETLANG